MVLFSGKCPQMMNYPVTHHLCVMLSRYSYRWKEKAFLIRSFSALESVVEEGDVTEKDKDDEDGIRFVTLESRVENKETVLNW